VFQQNALARAAFADNRSDFTPMDVEVNPVENPVDTQRFNDILQLN
jgi:hypothetical protein